MRKRRRSINKGRTRAQRDYAWEEMDEDTGGKRSRGVGSGCY